MGKSAAVAQVPAKASIMLATAQLLAIFDPHWVSIAKPRPIDSDDQTAAAVSLRQKPSLKPPWFEERQDLSMTSLMGSRLRSSHIANAPQK